jgi:hypothetical protein
MSVDAGERVVLRCSRLDGHLLLLYIGQGEVTYKCAAWLLVQYPCTGVQYLRFDDGPGGSRFLCTSWQLLFLSGSGFEGGLAGACVWLLFTY